MGRTIIDKSTHLAIIDKSTYLAIKHGCVNYVSKPIRNVYYTVVDKPMVHWNTLRGNLNGFNRVNDHLVGKQALLRTTDLARKISIFGSLSQLLAITFNCYNLISNYF